MTRAEWTAQFIDLLDRLDSRGQKTFFFVQTGDKIIVVIKSESEEYAAEFADGMARQLETEGSVTIHLGDAAEANDNKKLN